MIAPEDLANPKVDEQSVMTYISYFRNAQPTKRMKERGERRREGRGGEKGEGRGRKVNMIRESNK